LQAVRCPKSICFGRIAGALSLGPRKKQSRSDLVDPRRLASRNVKTADDLYNYKVSQFNQGRNLWSLRLL